MLFIGVMSGTSCDGIDVALVDIDESQVQCRATHFKPYSENLRNALLAVIAGESLTAAEFSRLDAQLGQAYAEAIKDMLLNHRINADQVSAIGLHGQTIDHQPPINTWQLGSPAHVSVETGIDVVADFRTQDVVLGGQGAPLAPALHQAVFASKKTRVVLNLGGIANITCLYSGGVIGFDTGPANCLMDLWAGRHLNTAHDQGGQWAASGQVDDDLLRQMLSDGYFSQTAPKSTGRERFNEQWLVGHVSAQDLSPEDVQATLAALTVQSVVDAITTYAKDAESVVVCGGGVHNRHLMTLLSDALTVPVINSVELGVDPDHVESILMAWLAHAHVNGVALNLKAVTGTKEPHIYGVRHSRQSR